MAIDLLTHVENVDVVKVTQGPHHHFFAYYDKHQWDVTGRFLLGMQTDFVERSPGIDDVARIGMVDLQADNEWIELGTTKAWCWQQGAMLQWLPGSTSSIIYNDRVADRFVSVIQNVLTGEKRTLPRPIYTVSNNGKWALSLNFSRNAITRPGYGYNGLVDIWEDDPHPADDGIYIMDLETGNHRLIVDIASLAAYNSDDTMRGATHWVNHLLFNPSGERFIFLHRWKGEGKRLTRFYTANLEGEDRHLFNINTASHFIWRDDDALLVWAKTETYGGCYYVCNDKTSVVHPVGHDQMRRDGHCTYSPDKRWILTDEYPDKNRMRPLILYNVKRNERTDIARFYEPPWKAEEFRCDLHPRWSRDGRWVCVDSTQDGSRQMYLIDVGAIVAKANG